MKRFNLVAVFAIFCLGSNALARGVSEPILRIGVHVGIGTTGYWDYPSESLVGSDDWGGVAADLGGVFKFRINDILNFITELNFGLNVVSRDIAFGRNRQTYYTQEETRTILKTDLPLLIRVWPLEYGFFDAGVQINANFWSTSNKEYHDADGNSLQSVSGDLETWKVRTNVTSLVFGFGLGGVIGDLGFRFILDLDRIHKNDKISYYNDGKEIYPYDEYVKIKSEKNIPGPSEKPTVFENKTKIWTLQFVVNYYFDLKSSR